MAPSPSEISYSVWDKHRIRVGFKSPPACTCWSWPGINGCGAHSRLNLKREYETAFAYFNTACSLTLSLICYNNNLLCSYPSLSMYSTSQTIFFAQEERSGSLASLHHHPNSCRCLLQILGVVYKALLLCHFCSHYNVCMECYLCKSNNYASNYTECSAIHIYSSLISLQLPRLHSRTSWDCFFSLKVDRILSCRYSHSGEHLSFISSFCILYQSANVYHLLTQ